MGVILCGGRRVHRTGADTPVGDGGAGLRACGPVMMLMDERLIVSGFIRDERGLYITQIRNSSGRCAAL